MENAQAGGKGCKIKAYFKEGTTYFNDGRFIGDGRKSREGNYVSGYLLEFNSENEAEKISEELEKIKNKTPKPYYSAIAKNAVYHAGNISYVIYPAKDDFSRESWNNKLIQVNVGSEDTLISGFNNNSDNENEFKRYNYFIIDGYPEIGDVEVGWNSFSVG
jgi:hypothetical protein